MGGCLQGQRHRVGAAGLEVLDGQGPAAGEGVQADRGGHAGCVGGGGGWGALLDGGADIGGGFQRLPCHVGEVAHTLYTLDELAWRRD